MLVLEELLAWEPGRGDCRFTVRRDTPFVHDGVVDSVCAIEWMGQAIAACLGNEAFSLGEGVRVGMIIGCPKLDLHQPSVAVGTTVLVRARRTRGSDVVSRFRCEVAVDGEDGDTGRIATGELTVFHAEAPPQ